MTRGLEQSMDVANANRRRAETSAPIHPLLAERWSSRAFDPDYELSDDQLTSLLEAARWTPSSANSQPWRFVVGRRRGTTFDLLFRALNPGNQAWAGNASALIAVLAAT